jgi:hypothetical protein
VNRPRKEADFQFDVFLSFATGDVGDVTSIYQSLVSNGKRVFRYDETMRQHGGRGFVRVIADALMDSRDLVIYWTATAHASHWVEEEYSTFYSQCYVPDKHMRRLIIFSPDLASDELLPAYLRQIQRVRTIADLLETFGVTAAASTDLTLQLQSAGIIGAYVARTYAISEFLPFLANESSQIVLIGSSFLRVLRETSLDWEVSRSIIQGKAGAGCDVRVLLTHPAVADLRANQEQRTFTELGRETLVTVRMLVEEWKLPRSNIRFYVGLPTIFGIKTSTAMLVSPYSYLANKLASPTFIVRRDGYMYDHFRDTHFDAWDSQAAVPLPDNLDSLFARLDGYAGSVTELLKTL